MKKIITRKQLIKEDEKISKLLKFTFKVKERKKLWLKRIMLRKAYGWGTL